MRGRMLLPPVRADVGFMKWLSGDHRTRAREGPAAADASTAARFFAGCGRLRARPVIDAWPPKPSGELNPAGAARLLCAIRLAPGTSSLVLSSSIRRYQPVTSWSRPG